jgi:hypothetical protein
MAEGNVFLDKELPESGPTPEMGARRLIQMTKQTLQQDQQYLEGVRKIVARHTKSALVAVLGADEATALKAIYNAKKKFVEDAAPNISVAAMD